MNPDYVGNLDKPNNDPQAVFEDARNLSLGKVYPRDLIEYSITNLLESAQAYYDDCDPNKLYYKVSLKNTTRNFCFDIQYLPHLLGLPNIKILIEAAIMSKLITVKTSPDNWFEVFRKTLEDNKQEIIDFDSDPSNQEEKKLNWDKIAEKVFAFLNMGILSSGDTYYYRENVSTKNKITNYLMVRPLVNNKIQGHIIIQFIMTEVNGEEVFIPTSIRFDRQGMKKIKSVGGKQYIFEGKITKIEQMQGGQYGKK